MTTLLRHRLRRFRRYALMALAIALVCVALLVGTVSQLLPMVEAHPDKVAAWLSERAGQPVAFDRLDTRWTRRGPILQLDGLRVGQGEGVRIGQAEVLVAVYSGLLPGAPLTELRLRGLALTLQRADDGRWSVRGLPESKTGGDPLDALRRLGELQVIGGQLQIQAPSIGLQTRIPRIDLRLRVDGERLRVGAKGWIDTKAAPVTAVLDFQRQRGDGQAWFSADPAELGAWSELLKFAGVQLRQGKGELQSWVQLQDNRVVAVSAEGELDDVQLAGAPLQGAAAPSVAFNKLQLRARWKAIDGGWRLDAPTLRIATDSTTQSLDGLLLAGGKHYAVQGKQLDAGPLLQVLALSDRLEPSLRNWLHRSKPSLKFADISVLGTADGPLRASGELLDASFAPVAGSPGVSGLRGHFEGDAQAFSLGLKPDHVVRFDWPTGFGVLHELQLSGELVGWREGAGWQVGTPALRVQGQNYAADVRGGLWFQGDGTRPWINLAAKIDDVPMTAAKQFWVRSSMSDAAIEWLDAALVDGTLRGGTGLAVGDLDDWPFTGNNGRFEAGGHIDDGSIRFQQDWPLMQHVNADINFIGGGFDLNGRGDLAGVKVDRLRAGIASFADSKLVVQASTVDESARLLAMLRQSPLQASYGDTLDNLSVAGPAAVNFDLLLPLHHDGGGHLLGDVDLRGVRMADKRWDLQFEGVSGKAQYSSDGFDAPALQVRHQERDGVLALRAGKPVKDPAHAFEAELSADLDAGKLLDRAPELAWLKPYVHGTSAWTVGVSLPKEQAGARTGPPTLLTLRSDLQGTRLQLPAPLNKPAADALATTVQAALPMGAGRIDVSFGKLMALAARSQNGKTGVQVTMGSDTVDHEPPADGLVVNGRTPSLDALEWISLARGGDSDGSDGGVALKQVDVLADQLLMVGGRFAQTRLQLRPGADAVAVQLDGPALAGNLRVPTADGGTVSGQLARVYWQAATAATTESSDTPAAPINPANIPPLALDIDDLQFATIKLGQTRLRTRPTSDGLQVQELAIRAPKQVIDVHGEWRGMGAQARTQATAQVQSEDLGDLLQRLGYAGQLRGGQGKVNLQAGWQGGPMAFNMATLEGGMDMNLRNGQLLEVDPGAGRVLGLLSVAQLPRRLLFDFRDLFSKGLAFNHVEGAMRFGNGQASTDKIAIESSAAEITIRGQADLVAQQFNQTIDVNPRSGNLLTVVGAVAGGPVGAAVGAAANAVLGKPLGEIGSKTYKVTGPWKDPKVEVLDRDAARLPPPLVTPGAASNP